MILKISPKKSHIKLKEHHVSIFHNIFFAFDAVFTGFFDFGFAAKCYEVVEGIGFGFDEAFFEVGVDDAGGFGGCVSGVDGPCAAFVGAGGEEGAEAEELVGSVNENSKA
jgi:hypothetical protein